MDDKRLCSDDLLPCAYCEADPSIYCEVSCTNGSHDIRHFKTADIQCKKCGHAISIQTGCDLAIIRKMWNVRA